MPKKKWLLIVLGLATMGACDESLVRKHAFWVGGEPIAGIETSDGVEDSVSELPPSLVRKTVESMEVEANGNIGLSVDVCDKALVTSMAEVRELKAVLYDRNMRIRDLEDKLEDAKTACKEGDQVKLPHGILESRVGETKTETINVEKHEAVSESVRWAATWEHVKLYYGGDFALLETDMYRNLKAAPREDEGEVSACATDNDCPSDWYCSSTKQCVDYSSNYCATATCGIGDGDCDSDLECSGDLKCGSNNCQPFHSLDHINSDGADCCYQAFSRLKSGDWTQHGDKEYLVDTSMQRNWNQSKFFCEQNGGSLVSIHSEEDQQLVDAILPYEGLLRNGGVSYWIALRRINCESEWTWDDGTPYNYQDGWDAGQPNGCRQCVRAQYEPDKTFRWDDLTCDANRVNDIEYAFCQRAVADSADYIITAVNLTHCPTGYRIQTSNACERAAMKLGYEFMGASVFYMHPGGCTIDLDGKVTHNYVPAEIGRANEFEKLICAKSMTCGTYQCPLGHQHKLDNENLADPSEIKCCEQKALGAHCVERALCESEIEDLKEDSSFMCDCIYNHEGKRDPTKCRKWLMCLHKQRSMVQVWFKELLELQRNQPLEGASVVQSSNATEEPTCIDPSTVDLFNLDCKCAETLQRKCAYWTDRQQCLQEYACAAPEVCEHWQSGRCPSRSSDSLVETRLRLENRVESTIGSDSKEAADASLRLSRVGDSNALDESVQRKCR